VRRDFKGLSGLSALLVIHLFSSSAGEVVFLRRHAGREITIINKKVRLLITSMRKRVRWDCLSGK
jgi:hypothetical protein